MTQPYNNMSKQGHVPLMLSLKQTGGFTGTLWAMICNVNDMQGATWEKRR